MHEKEVTFIDLFAGCGGFSKGLEMAGLKPIAHVELDDWACDSLKRNFPNAENIHKDIKNIKNNECSVK